MGVSQMIADSSKIALIIPYFGTSPLYYPYWLYSASLNPSIDFHLFTDHLENSINAANIVIHRTNFLDFIARLQATLGVKINGLGPYKLCDLRPAFGYVLKDELCAYDFWGYCDIDVILGDIRRFLPNDMSQYDKLFEHGHFTLIRNSQDCRDNFQKQIPGLCSFLDVFETPEIFASTRLICRSTIGRICKYLEMMEYFMISRRSIRHFLPAGEMYPIAFRNYFNIRRGDYFGIV